MKRLILISAMSLAIMGCSGNEEAVKEVPPALVNVEEVVLADVPVYIRAVGTINAHSNVGIFGRTNGELLEIIAKEGAFVEAGDVLFRLDTKALNVALNAAQASLESNKAQLKKAKDDLARSQKLSKSGFTTEEQLQQARTNVAVLEAGIKVAQSNVENAELNIDYAEIKAPISGRVGSINVDQGSLISPYQQQLTSVSDIDTMTVEFALPERYLRLLRDQEKVKAIKVVATTADGTIADGILTFIDDIDTRTGTFNVKADFDNSEQNLWAGQYVNVQVEMDILEQVRNVPEKAVSLGPDGPFVYVVENNEALLRLVETDIEEAGRIVIESGVEAGEKVVVDGHVRLYDKAKVSVVAKGE